MINLSIQQAKSAFFDRRAVMNAVDRAERKVLSKFGAFVRTASRSSIRTRKRVSRPGEPPSSHTGLLKRFIFFVYERQRHSVIVGPVRLNQKAGEAPSTLEFGGPSKVFDRRLRRIRPIQIKARPYMRPALEKERAKLPPLWANSVTPSS